MVAPHAVSPPLKSTMRRGITGMMIPSASMSMTTVTKMKAKAARPGCTASGALISLRFDRLGGAQCSEGGVVRGVNPVYVGRGHAQVAKLPVLQAVDPPVDRKRLSARPGLLHNRGLADVASLLDDIQLAEAIDLRGNGGDRREQWLMLLRDVLHVTQPVVDESEPVAVQRGAHTAASI